jgi:dihydroorotate dehydrogenase electron transfer subunit
MPDQFQSTATILANDNFQCDYWRLRLQAPDIAGKAVAGQFVHLAVPGLEHRVLRRPFSIHNAEPDSGVLTVVYKVVGEGTRALSQARAGLKASVLGPLGRGFTPAPQGRHPVLVAGGYGCAAVYLLTKTSPVSPVVLLGGRTAGDIILAEEFRHAGAEVRIATDDGSLGTRGRVTVLLEEILRETPDAWISACGPLPMLKAVAKMTSTRHDGVEVSLDEHFCCGVGACFGCVVKVKDTSEQGWRYARSCQEGPVFPASQVVWD